MIVVKKKHDGAGDGGPVEVALGHGGSGRRLTEATAEHLRQPSALAAVQQDHADQQQATR